MNINIKNDPPKNNSHYINQVRARKGLVDQEIMNKSDCWHRIFVSDANEQMNNFYFGCVILGKRHL